MHASLWTDLFVLGVPALEKVLRALIVYFFLVVALRLAGKRELAQLNPFDLVVLLTLSNTVQNAIIGDDNSVLGGLLGATTLLVTNYLVVRFLFRYRGLDHLMEGEPAMLIQRGRLLRRQMEKELVTRAELEEAARKQGFASLDEVERAQLEPGGAITFIAKQPAPEETRHIELLARLDQILAKLS